MSAKRALFVVLIASGVMLAVGIGPRFAGSAHALPPAQEPDPEGVAIPYPGRLDDEMGQPVDDGVYDFTFALYGVETGGEPLWSEVQEGVAVRAGAFNVLLGSADGIPMGALAGGARWLAVGVRGPGEADFTGLVPRQQLSAAAPASVVSPAAPSAGLTCPHDHFGETWSGTSGDGLRIVTSDDNANAIKGSIGPVHTVSNNGIFGETATGNGVYGRSNIGGKAGVYGYNSSSGYGVYGTSSSGQGGHFVASAGDGVYGSADGTSMWGVWGFSDDSYGVTGGTDVSGGYGLYTYDKIYTGGGCVGCTSMLIAQNGGDGTLEPGDVVAVVGIAEEPSGFYGRPVLLVHKVDAASRQSVVGVVEGRYVSELVIKEGIVVEDAHTTTEPVAPGEYMTVVYRGLAQVKVDASPGVIQVGDLLASSGTSGHVMLATAGVEGESGFSSITGTIIGKAMGPLERGQGLIWVLVDLQ
jgi:hypothetical protein